MSKEESVILLVNEHGPLTGAEIHAAVGGDFFDLWRVCMLSSSLQVRRTGRRFVRLDRRVEGLARLSPSILREFMTYSVIGLKDDPASLERKAEEMITNIRLISRRKKQLAAEAVSDILSGLDGKIPMERMCVILAGDIVYEMAHNVPRPERSTGRLAKGSDLDLVFVLDDKVSDSAALELDEEIYRVKFRYLTNPALLEEIDYVVKKMTKVHRQAAFDSFKHMVACKILDEGYLLHGSSELFQEIREILSRSGASKKLLQMRERAEKFGNQSLKFFLDPDLISLPSEKTHLFYSTDEFEEFE